MWTGWKAGFSFNLGVAVSLGWQSCTPIYLRSSFGDDMNNLVCSPGHMRKARLYLHTGDMDFVSD